MDKNKIIYNYNGSFSKEKKTIINNNEVIYFSDSSPTKKSSQNEDSLAVIPVDNDNLILVVSDGMGGMPAGEQASMIVIEALCDSLKTKNNKVSVCESIINGIEKANKDILNSKIGSGATVSIAAISKGQLRTYQVGDSLILLAKEKGKIKYQSMSHSPIGFAIECGAINKNQAMMHHSRNLISNYVGLSNMYIQVSSIIDICAGDNLIISSDGLSDNLYENEILEFISETSLNNGVRKMIAECQHNMKEFLPDRNRHPDDLSFICFRKTKS